MLYENRSICLKYDSIHPTLRTTSWCPCIALNGATDGPFSSHASEIFIGFDRSPPMPITSRFTHKLQFFCACSTICARLRDHHARTRPSFSPPTHVRPTWRATHVCSMRFLHPLKLTLKQYVPHASRFRVRFLARCLWRFAARASSISCASCGGKGPFQIIHPF